MNADEFREWLENLPNREYELTEYFHPTFEGMKEMVEKLAEVWGKHNEKGKA